MNRLAPTEDFDTFVELIAGAFRTALSGLPARCTRDLPMPERLNGKYTASLSEAVFVESTAERLEPHRG